MRGRILSWGVSVLVARATSVANFWRRATPSSNFFFGEHPKLRVPPPFTVLSLEPELLSLSLVLLQRHEQASSQRRLETDGRVPWHQLQPNFFQVHWSFHQHHRLTVQGGTWSLAGSGSDKMAPTY